MMESVVQSLTPSVLSQSLPLYLTRFVGREGEQEALTSLLTTARLLTLVGAGGIGKTRLALHIASGLGKAFPDGICLVELSSLAEPSLVPQAVASALAIGTGRDEPLVSLLVAALQERRCLLILDSCEHVLTACAALVEALLAACPHLHILATSREALHIAIETQWRVAPLSAPHPDHVLSMEQLASYESVQLFCERATEIDPRFCLTEQNAAAVVRICRQLDGLPLALELAAARLQVLSVDQLAARLNERFLLLMQGARTKDARQHTLYAMLDWSYGLLTPAEQTVFQSLAVFAGSGNLEAVEQIVGPEWTAPYALFEVLAHLVNKSLVIAEEQDMGGGEAAEVRYRLLDTMRQYAQEKVQQAGQWQRLCERHCAWYLHVATQLGARLSGSEQLTSLQALETEMPQFRVALTRTLVTGHLDMTAQLADALRRVWIIHNHFSEGRHWFESLLAVEENEQRLLPALRARVLFGAAEFARYQGAYDRAVALLERQIALLRTLDDAHALAEAQSYLGLALGARGDYAQAHRLFLSSLALYRASGHEKELASTLLSEAFVILAQGRYQQATALSEEVCQMLRETGNTAYLLYALFTLAQATLLQGKLERTREVCLEALHLAQALQQTYGLAASLGLIAGLLGSVGMPEQAARFFGAAQAILDRIQAPHPPAGRALQERMILPVRTALGKKQFALQYAAGEASAQAEILAEAEAILQGIHIAVEKSSRNRLVKVNSNAPGGLSRREREVLALVATGLTDVQVAQRLLISPQTVGKHLRSIYAKLNVSSRSGATRFAVEHGLF